MAAKIIDVHRPAKQVATSAGTGSESLASELSVTIDLDSDGRRLHTVVFLEADHAGLIAEFVAGSVTTILDAAVVAYLAALTDDEVLPAAAAAYLGTTKTYPAP